MRNAAIITAILLALAAGSARAEVVTPLMPSGQGLLAPVGVGEKAKDYVVVGPEGVEFRLAGPGELSGWLRAHLPQEHLGPLSLTARLEGVPAMGTEWAHDFTPSPKWAYDGRRPGTPSGGKKLAPVAVPEGNHVLRVTPVGGTLLLRLTWKSDRVETTPIVADAPKKPTKKKSPWKTSVTVGLETIYDDNFLRYSDEFQGELASGMWPHRYQADQTDSHILAPSLDLYAQRKLTDWGNTRFRFKVKRWQYIQGNLKSNMSFDYQVRQFFSGGRSLEIGYNYAPQQYIRELSDHPPGDGVDDDTIYGEFRYTRNVFMATWRQKLHKKVSLKLLLTRSLRYYNKPYMENDIKDLGLRATVAWKAHKDWTLTADYGYADAPARGYDEVGETRETSDNSDPSYNQDLVQLQVAWSPKWAAPVFAKVTTRVRHSVSWFTSEKSVEDDPYHAGRIDRVWQFQLKFDRKLPHGVRLQVGGQYAQREVESPWHGDIEEDKNYDQRRYWIGLTYKL